MAHSDFSMCVVKIIYLKYLKLYFLGQFRHFLGQVFAYFTLKYIGFHVAHVLQNRVSR